MDDLNNMTLENFRLWSLKALKVYLSHRNLSVNGTFDELSARAFCAWEQNLPVNEQAEQAEQRLLQEYKHKLLVEDDVLPDPFSLHTGWQGEKTAIHKWPSVYLVDIAKYLNNETHKEIFDRLLNEYKEGKAYRYFHNKWVQEVFYHEIRPNSDKCILKAKCVPSMSVNSKKYDVWVVVRKDKDDGESGGEIVSAYCTCTAGMHGTCNHIAGVLFRVENAVKTGETKTSSTSMKSRWNVPSSKPQTKDAVAVMDVTWKKGHYRKNPAEVEDERRKHSLKLNFTPLNKRQTEEVKNITKLKNDLYNLVKEDVPNSCFILTIEKRHITAKVDPQMPHSLGEIANRLDPEASDPRGEFLQRIAISKEQCGVLSEATVEQSNSKAWNEHRKGRVTASLFHRISSRVDTLRKDSSADPTKLVDAILRQKESHPTTAMKHGLSLEPHAKKAYTQVMRKNHKKFKSKNTGLLVSSANPYMAASADLEIECQCCGKGLCEIKCPESIKDTAPSSSNQAYLIEESGKVQVSKNHAYFYQIQGQMAIHGRQYCDLFVYTYHGSVTVRVMFEKEFWDVLEEKLSWFWLSHVLPALLNWNCNDNKTTDNTKENPKTPTKIQTLSRSHAVCRALEPLSPKDNSKNIQQPKKRRRLNKVPIYLCGMCGLDCVDEPQSEADQSVSCDVCGVWVHYICAQVTDTHLETVDLWSCGKCSK